MIITFKNIKYQLYTEDKTAKVIGYQDEPVDVRIPEYVEYENKKYKVTEIGDGAFYVCTSLTSITIPNSVKYIGNYAFYDCKSLTSITIGNGVTKIGDEVFSHCEILQSITIPDSVTEIGRNAFYCCNSLKSITIPNSVTKIRESAFYSCKNLQSVTIPNSVTEIENLAFARCTILESINIPDSVTNIGKCALYRIGMTLPKKYTEDGKLIGYKAFNNDMTCRDFQYEEGKSYEIERKIECCVYGFHACTNPLDVFNYYNGQIGKDIVIHEVYLSRDIDDNSYDSKVCASKIEIGRRLTMKDINEIINRK